MQILLSESKHASAMYFPNKTLKFTLLQSTWDDKLQL